jgi:myosin heavy subunit
MNINRCVAIICCLLVSFTTSSKAASSSEEQFLSDISSIKLPGDPPPSVRKGSSESSDNTINHSQPSVSSIKNNISHQGHEDMLKKENRMLRQRIASLQNKLRKKKQVARAPVVPSQAQEHLSQDNTELMKKNTSLVAQEKDLNQQISSLQVKQSEMYKTISLQEKALFLAQQNLSLTQHSVNKDRDENSLHQQITLLQKSLKENQISRVKEAQSLQAQLDTLSKQNAELTAKNDTLSADGEKLRQQMSARDTQLTGSQKAAAEAAAALQAKLDTLSKQNTELAAKNDTLSADGEKLRQQLETLQQELNDNQTSRAEEVKTLQVKVDALNKQNMALTANPSTPSDSNKAISLDTPLQQHSYTLGAILAEDTRARVKESSAMGIDIDKGIMLTGLQDGYNGHLRIDKDKLKSISDEMNHVATSALKKEADSGKKRLDKAVVGKTILDQKGGVVVVLDKKGRSEYNKGDKVIFDSIEKIVGGKSIVNSYNNKVTYTDNMSFMLKSAVEGGKKGGQVTLYGFAGNIYTPSSLPEGVKVDTPVQVSLHLH